MKWIALLAMIGAGCAVGPEYQRPDLPEVERFRDSVEAPSGASIADLPWWDVFHDETLRGLIEDALEANGDLRAAAARVEAARARAGIAKDALLPSVNVGAAASREQFRIVPPIPSFSGATTNEFAVSANVSWELDVWGKLRRGIEAAQADAASVEDQRQGIVQMLVADVAQAYLELLQLDALYELYRETREARAALLRLFSAQLQGGTGTLVQTSNAEALVFDIEATLPLVEAQLEEKENQLSILLGRPPSSIHRGPAMDSHLLPPAVPPGVPASLLERRPDLRALEQNLRAAVARVGVADANLLPSISLTGMVGLLSADMAKLLSSGEWNYGANTSWLAPILQGKSLRDQRDAAKADAAALAATYQQAVLRALGDVADALVGIESARVSAQARERQVDSLQTRLRLVLDQYNAGTASYVEVTLAYQDLLPAQIAEVTARSQRFLAVVQLYRALGGGWGHGPPPAAGAGEGGAGD